MAGDEELSSLDDWGPFEDDWAPVHFLVPPPPPPPSLGSVCSGNEFYCQLEGGPMGAHYNRASFPSLPIIAVCSSVVLVAVLVASFLFWRHKTKAQNLLPCKNEQPGHMGELGTANGVSYEDVLINHHPTRIPQSHLAGSQTLMPLEILDVKLGEIGPPQITALHSVPCYNRRDGGQMVDSKTFHPVYEEVSQAPSGDKSMTGKSYESDFDESGKLGGRSLTSEDDFAEEDFGDGSGHCSATSSVRGSTGGDLCRDPVSSDEGTGEDCDYMVHDLPEMLPSDNSFSYPSKHRHMHSGVKTDKLRNHPVHSHRHGSNVYPPSDRTASVLPLTQRAVDPAMGHKLHSNSSTERSPHHGIPSPFVHSVPPINPRNNFPSITASPQWPISHGSPNQMDYPTNASSQENIYSTIDEDEVDYPIHPSLPSLANTQRGTPLSKYSSGLPKNVPPRVDRPIPPLSQRNMEDNSSYGDIMPTYNSAFM
ncbi:uncharacterized protein [Parasteatoda tepidariorum]|uniref:uncharacterized protein n=1 Tax=Parasteatoda tepidariorum TaxID=114398 RepID=UPI00077F8240|nr:uncharacterized protein LOC107440268 [Parasteatoda tepidariorum]